MSRKLPLAGRSALFLSLALVGCGGQEPTQAQEQVGSAEQAMHSWGSYHWARTSNPFLVKLGDNLSSNWKSYLSTASSDWSKSTVLDTTIVAGQGGSRCSATAGRVEVCNDTYGYNGWLGVAQIWASGSHITQAIVKLNDSYFNSPTYNTVAWRNSVMCQEVGHTFGLGHNDEDFNTVNGTCMDYANDPTKNQHPNTHDYDQLKTIYAHLDSTNTVSSDVPKSLAHGPIPAALANADDRSQWGHHIGTSPSGRVQLYARQVGEWTLLTEVTLADFGGEHHHGGGAH